MTEAGKTSHGVQELIEQLRRDGVESGEQEAEAIINDARQKAKRILEDAERKASALREQVMQEVTAERRALNDAIKLAYRDAILMLKDSFTRDLAQCVKQLVTSELRDTELLRKLILEVGGRSVTDEMKEKSLELLLPDHAPGVDELRASSQEMDALNAFVIDIARDQLRAGVSLVENAHRNAGIHVQVVDEELEINLTDHAVSELLLQHLLPRYRALLDGVVRVPNPDAGTE